MKSTKTKFDSFDDFVRYIYSLEDYDMLEDFLYGITTDAERIDLPKRATVVTRLLQGISQHEIADQLGVGVATVTRGSKELSSGKFKDLKRQYEKDI